ncbi:MAG TPA: quinone-dependent dihydroorotate dehydrogenase [Thermoanaerobaculia bacterium]|nr:quinone-dependent dihydroorotate dehydrogenase [Thermoanaerobaculia bacterium]
MSLFSPAYALLRPLLFRLDPEASHGFALAGLRLAAAFARAGGGGRGDDPRLAQTLFGCTFPNPVGLAAGFDKDALAVRALPGLGFGFAEVGTVTPLPQAGNPRPRLFRYPAARSVQNAMGFNNAGLAALTARLRRLRPAPLPLGVNLGKNKATPPEAALADYETLLRALAELCDYLVVNLSSPNTPGLRDLQNEGFVRALLTLATGITRRPVLVKLSPDLAPERAADLAEIAVSAGAAGIVATNTTTDYTLLPGARDFGGLSGRVLTERSFLTLRALARRLCGRTVLISVGGIDSGAEAYRRLRAGASLVQIYTGLVFEGPGLPRRIKDELLRLLDRDGVRTIGEVIGTDV